jgi:hypothetical protein
MDQSQQVLKDIATKGVVSEKLVYIPPITEGHRLRNDILQELVQEYEDDPEISKEELFDIILEIDKKIESGQLTNGVLTELDKIIKNK